jgi:hypothetical protein
MVERTVWPELHWASWRETAETLHRFTQVVGKIRLASTPPVNHWWNAPLYPTARGLTTSLMFHGPTAFEIELDLLAHRLEIATTDGTLGAMPLVREPVSRFYGRLMHLLRDLQLDVSIWTTPVEVPDRTPFEKDDVHASYDPGYVERFWRALVATSRVLGQLRTRFIGKASPIHFFWGSFDLALTLFSGRRAPPRPGADLITREAYSHEVLSFGFWPGGAGVDDAAFYAYAAPEPPGFAETTMRPAEAYYHSDLHLFALPYKAVQSDADPDRRLLEFYERAYEAGVELGAWDRAALERGAGEAPRAWAPEPERPTPFH